MFLPGREQHEGDEWINGALTKTQARLNIPDSADKFEDDIIKGAAGVGHTEAPGTHGAARKGAGARKRFERGLVDGKV